MQIVHCSSSSHFTRISFNVLFLNFLAIPHGMWELSSPARNQTSAPPSKQNCGGVCPALVLGAAVAAAKSIQSCPTLCEPIDGSPPVSSIPGILQARTLEWVAISCWVGSTKFPFQGLYLYIPVCLRKAVSQHPCQHSLFECLDLSQSNSF